MSQIEELHRRLTAAMDRIGTGAEALSGQMADASADDRALREALDEEKTANAQLEERLKSVKARYAEELEALRAAAGSDEAAALRAELDDLKAQMGDGSEVETLKAQLAEATANLMSVEAARSDLAQAMEALERSDETALLKAEVQALTAQGEAAEVELAALKSELANSERVGELSAELEMLRAERASHGSAMSRLSGDLQQLRKANESLQATVTELRRAAEAGLSDPQMLNRATQTELDALRTARATDAAEAHAVLARLEPLLAQANLAEGEVE